jgi:predicted MFS family arabinose efflux permease
MLALGIAEVFADATAATLMPALVPPRFLATSTHRGQTAFLTMNQLAGPPVGAFLFALGWAVPFGAQIVCVLAAVVLVSRIASSPAPDGAPGLALPPDAGKARIRTDIAEGARWIWGNAAVRTLAVIILVFNVTWGASWSVLVLWSRNVVGMDDVGFGLLTTGSAIGGIIGTSMFPWLSKKVSFATLMKAFLSMEVSMHAGLALTRHGAVAIAIMVVFGAYAFMWGTIAMTVRQRAVPHHLQGRVTSVANVANIGGLVIGQAIGGVIAEQFGLTMPMWFAFVTSGITLALIWRHVNLVVAAEAQR